MGPSEKAEVFLPLSPTWWNSTTIGSLITDADSAVNVIAQGRQYEFVGMAWTDDHPKAQPGQSGFVFTYAVEYAPLTPDEVDKLAGRGWTGLGSVDFGRLIATVRHLQNVAGVLA